MQFSFAYYVIPPTFFITKSPLVYFLKMLTVLFPFTHYLSYHAWPLQGRL